MSYFDLCFFFTILVLFFGIGIPGLLFFPSIWLLWLFLLPIGGGGGWYYRRYYYSVPVQVVVEDAEETIPFNNNKLEF